ncbi:MAG: TrkA C-terminal domain-containing protein [Deltaproteobacteria bacterium]
MIALFGLFTIILLSILVVRIGATALEMTGLSAEIATFQAQSAFSGVGFTTSESEMIVTHPVRRRIVRILILLGSAGITSSMAALVLTFVGESGKDIAMRVAWLAIGVLAILLLSRLRIINVLMKRVILRALRRWTKLHIYDYEQLLGLGHGYAISRIRIHMHSPFCNKQLSQVKPEEGILVLAIYRREHGRETHIGAPHGDTVIRAGDDLICYSQKEIGEFFNPK